LRRITYVRYADDLIAGITGPRSLLIKFSTIVENFIRSDLHLRVYEVVIMSCDKGVVQFLGFNIFLSSIRNKTKSNKTKSIAKYKKISTACLKENDARLSQAYFNSIKHGFLNYLQYTYEKFNLKKSESIDMTLIQNFVNESLKELL
jgi:hypothetical protein